MIQIAPSLFAADFACLAAEVHAMAKAGADMFHFDVMDGHFVPNLSMGSCLVAGLRKETDIVFDVHLMVTAPAGFVKDFADAGADIITFHIESRSDVSSTIDRIKQLGKRVGIALNPATPADAVFPYLDSIDRVLVMTVEPGFGGQTFMDMSSKISHIRNACSVRKIPMDIQVDGGINPETAIAVTRAGANILVAGSALFSRCDYTHAIKELRQRAASGV